MLSCGQEQEVKYEVSETNEVYTYGSILYSHGYCTATETALSWSEFVKKTNYVHYKISRSEFLQVGLVRIALGSGRIGQNFFRIWQDWSEFLQRWARLVRLP